MANESNLKIPSPSEARENGRKGGIASGKARRKKADLKKALQTILTSKVPTEKTAQKLKKLGFENTNEMAIMLSLIQQASKGNVRAIELINKMSNNDKDEYDIQEQKERIKSLKLANQEKEKRDNTVSEQIVVVDNWSVHDE